ncbi:hypothetical protein ACY2DA_02825 [Staphylococcus simulans]
MNHSNLLLGETFSKFRERPKWALNLIIWIIVVIGSVWLTFKFSDWTEMLKQTNPDLSQNNLNRQKRLWDPSQSSEVYLLSFSIYSLPI